MSSMDNVVAVYPTSSALKLQGNWTDLTIQGKSGSSSTIAVGVAGAYGSLSFTGNQIAVYGLLEAGQPVESTYSIDGASPNTYVGPSNVTETQSEVEFFISPMLSAGQHQLVFNVTNATADNLFVLEFVLYQGTGSTTSGVAGESATATSLATDVGAASTPSAVGASSGSSTNVGAIVGGVVGGVAGLAIIGILGFFWLRGRNKRPYFYAEAGELLRDEVKPTPFTQGSGIEPDVSYKRTPEMSSYRGPPPTQYTAVNAQNQPAQASEAGDSSAYSSAAGSSRPTLTVIGGPAVTSSPNQTRSKAAEAGLLSVAQPQHAMYHADSGMRFDASGQPQASGSGGAHEARTPTDVPPSYSES
ncbi:uncharacterized protein C8Q71DRAFT_725501 [Rhodofomes roseus]|uniref:Uncharacterized protein n=1 Tax=Rhodofomes roseus TaxID=34475 RepID=A0ABQ8K8Z2_9APHY|nr:uncharacterized protein C8Q71DRAFT_725501 [Rhodofomes roseus]KAH9833728.1 hypothetical protein C8Q71DRAFT_725501 [Rhodofomes roseus]